MRHVQALASALAALVAAMRLNTSHARIATDPVCSRQTTALTSACDDACFQGRPCLAYGAAETAVCTNGTMNKCQVSATSGCRYSCFKYSPSDFVEKNLIDFTAFTFLVPFGTYKSRWEQKWKPAEVANARTQTQQNETGSFPSANNDVVSNMEPLAFLPSTKSVTIAGGPTVDGIRGRMVNMHLAPQVFFSQSNLQSLTLANMALEQITQSTLPAQLVNLSLVNCAMASYPADIPSMSQLRRLDLSKNYFTSFPNKFSLDGLRSLNLSTNNLESFEGVFPALQELDLSGNVFRAIPASIYAMNGLQYLDLRKNSFSSVQLTETDFKFLNSIPALKIDNLGATTCDASQQRMVGNVSVCVQSTGGSTSVSRGGGSGSTSGAVIGGIVAGVVVIAVIVFIVWRRHRHKQRQDKFSRTLTPGNLNESTHSVSAESRSLWTDQELLSLKIPNEDIQDIRRIGVGACCAVYLVQYRQTLLAASKRLKRDEINWKNTQRFAAEIKLVAGLDHPRVVSLIGVAWTIESDLQALFEYMDGGDLRSFVQATTTPRPWSRVKVQIAVDIVEALVYVHSFSPPIVHRDLKSRNILLAHDLRAKLSDFGIARYRSEEATMTVGVGTGRWLAPEVISGSNDYDQSCDIFAFGVVLTELDTHELPYEDVRGPSGNRLADVALLQMVAAGKLIPTISMSCPPEILKIALRCMSFDPNARPTAVEVAYAMRTILHGQHC